MDSQDWGRDQLVSSSILPAKQATKQISYIQYDILRNNRTPFDGPMLPRNIVEGTQVSETLTGYPSTHLSRLGNTAEIREELARSGEEQGKFCSEFQPEACHPVKARQDINQIHDQNKQDLRDLIHKMND